MKHELDKEVEDILEHFGIKGMRWDIRRTPEEIKEDAKNNVDAAGEALENAGDEVFGHESVLEEFGDVVDAFLNDGDLRKETDQLKDAIRDKVSNIGESTKKRGKGLLERFGRSIKITSRTKTEIGIFTPGSATGRVEEVTVTKDLFGNVLSKTKRVNGKIVKTKKGKGNIPKKKSNKPKEERRKSTPDYYSQAKDR